MDLIKESTLTTPEQPRAKKLKNRSFQAVLFTQFSIAGFTLAIIAAFAYSYMASTMISRFYEREGIQATENFAQLSALALLYDSGENAKEAALATLNFPSIKHVAIISAQNTILLDEGETNEKILSSLNETQWLDNNARLFPSSKATWQIAAPVYTVFNDDSDPDLILDDEKVEETYLGYVVIQIDTSEVRSFQLDIFLRNLVVGLGYGFAFAIILSLTLRRLLKPMNALTSVMEETTDGAYKSTDIDPKASLEVVKIADVYNQMIFKLAERDQKLRGQKDLLETEVALRTSELVQARDTALEANRHKSEFLANITHELRTPLQSILGYTEVVKEMLEDEGVYTCEQDVDKITHNADHLLGLINSILDISKIEAGKMEVSNQNVNIKSLLNRATDTVVPLIEKNNNALKIITDQADHNFFVDEKKLFQILLNLLSNAAKFTHEGLITLSAIVDEQQLIIEVRDTGIGIDQEQQDIIFEPFRQIDGSETRQFLGTGLGLSITMHFTQLLGGKMTLESEVNQGSCFSVFIPKQSAEQTPTDDH
ncbi:ATP-binding protein [Pseudomonadales bacterium]|nr:ATP-binding protein [Pseudomonadales bacterium]